MAETTATVKPTTSVQAKKSSNIISLIAPVLCLLAGWLKLPMLPALSMIFIGKTVRYLMVAAVTLHWLG